MEKGEVMAYYEVRSQVLSSGLRKTMTYLRMLGLLLLLHKH
jgi:hypothetical protein